MTITRKKVADKIVAYLKHQLTLSQLVEWAENVVMDGSVEEEDMDGITEVACRLGVADVKTFGLTWEDCQKMLYQLGYKVEINVKLVA